jgi:glycosyltransferase involved in cell wall biosynthesis
MEGGRGVTGVALVVTVRNEAETIDDLLASVDAQSRPPDEVVVVDGGSTDGTIALLERWASSDPHRVVLQAPGANIAKGRNLAIAKSSAPAVAVTDAGCVLDAHWLECLARALDGADVAMGYYEPLATHPFERIATCLTLPGVDEIDPARFMPSSRSVAFRREVWDRVGGYPDWLDIGEDMYFDFAVRRTGVTLRFVPDAIVGWRPQRTIRGFLHQYFRYARGDAIAGMYPRRHALRFGAYIVTAILFVLSFRRPWLLAIPIAGAGFWLRHAYRRAWQRLGAERVLAFVLLPFLAAIQDAAKMAGYVAGLPSRRTKR